APESAPAGAPDRPSSWPARRHRLHRRRPAREVGAAARCHQVAARGDPIWCRAGSDLPSPRPRQGIEHLPRRSPPECAENAVLPYRLLAAMTFDHVPDITAEDDPHRTPARRRRTPAALRAMRPKQWIKNVLVFAAPLASGGLLDL